MTTDTNAETEVETHPGWCERNTVFRCDGFHNSAEQVVRGTILIEPLDHECCNVIEVALCQMDPLDGITSSLHPHVRMMLSADFDSPGGAAGLSISRLTSTEARHLADVLAGAAERLDVYLASDDPAVPA